MTITDPYARINLRKTPQTEKAKPNQVKNNAGGFVFKVSGDDQIRRFLILGTEGGTYYQGEVELTKQNAQLILAYAENDPARLVEIIVEVSLAGRAPKQNPTIFALAAACSSSDLAGRKAAFDAIPLVIRTASHLTLFAKYIEQFRGWGTGLKKATQKFYTEKNADQLAYQLVKYRQRNGFTQRDLLRIIHPKAATPEHNALYGWVTQGNASEGLPRTVQGFLKAQEASTPAEWAKIVRDYKLSWEMLPDSAMNEPKVWNALLDVGVPLNALVRQLSRLTNIGVLGGGLSKGSRTADVVAKITDAEYIKKSRMHPFNVLVAHKTYASGQGFRGGNTWVPVTAITNALDKAFYLAFDNVEPANKKTMLALDVSGSMGVQIQNSPLSARDASAAMSLITAATEPVTETYGFTSNSGSRYSYTASRNAFMHLDISPKQRLNDVIKTISNLPFSGTDCALPMIKALELGLEVETFVVYTDSETWAGNIHPHQALQNYRNKTGIPARLVVVGMVSNGFSIADPSDAGELDVVGFDSSAPSLIADFSAGRI